MTLRGSVTCPVSVHQDRSCSFVVAQPTRTKDFSPGLFARLRSVIAFRSPVKLDELHGQMGANDSVFTVSVALSRSIVDIRIVFSALANDGDHE
jgi:hypothetical protein